MQGKLLLYSSLNLGYLRHLTQVRVRSPKGKNYESTLTKAIVHPVEIGEYVLIPNLIPAGIKIHPKKHTDYITEHLKDQPLLCPLLKRLSAPELGQLSEIDIDA